MAILPDNESGRKELLVTRSQGDPGDLRLALSAPMLRGERLQRWLAVGSVFPIKQFAEKKYNRCDLQLRATESPSTVSFLTARATLTILIVSAWNRIEIGQESHRVMSDSPILLASWQLRRHSRDKESVAQAAVIDVAVAESHGKSHLANQA